MGTDEVLTWKVLLEGIVSLEVGVVVFRVERPTEVEELMKGGLKLEAMGKVEDTLRVVEVFLMIDVL